MDFISTPRKSVVQRTVEQLPKPKTTKKGKKDMSKDQFKKTKQTHKNEIAKLKAKRAAMKSDIKKHKMLIKQAKLVYKMSKMKGTK